MSARTRYRRFLALYEAALNLGMTEGDALFYASEALARETAVPS